MLQKDATEALVTTANQPSMKINNFMLKSSSVINNHTTKGYLLGREKASGRENESLFFKIQAFIKMRKKVFFINFSFRPSFNLSIGLI